MRAPGRKVYKGQRTQQEKCSSGVATNRQESTWDEAADKLPFFGPPFPLPYQGQFWLSCFFTNWVLITTCVLLNGPMRPGLFPHPLPEVRDYLPLDQAREGEAWGCDNENPLQSMPSWTQLSMLTPGSHFLLSRCNGSKFLHCSKWGLVQKSSMKRIEFTHIDLVSEVNKRRTAMAARYQKVFF